MFPAYSLLSAFGEAAPLNLDLQREDRVLSFPFHFLNNNHAMNVKPQNYGWSEFYDRLIDLYKYSFTSKKIFSRFRANDLAIAKGLNVVRSISSEGWGRLKYHRHIRHLLDTDRSIRDFFEGETVEIPSFYIDRIRRELGEFWEYLPDGAIHHDPLAYLKKTDQQDYIPLATA